MEDNVQMIVCVCEARVYSLIVRNILIESNINIYMRLEQWARV